MFSNSTTTENSYNAALARFMKAVFNYMAGGVALSGLAAYVTLHTPLYNIAISGGFSFIFLIVWFGYGFFANKIISKLSATGGLMTFVGFSIITGIAFAPTVAQYTASSVTTAFFVAAGIFMAMSLFGINSKKSLSGWGTFLSMAWMGIIVAILINVILFLFGIQTVGMSTVISFIVVPLVSATVAYEVNSLKEFFHTMNSEDEIQKAAILGAVDLYTSFVVLFLHLLSIFGDD